MRGPLPGKRGPYNLPWKSTSALLGALVLCGCSMSEDIDIARRAVEQFHHQMAAQQDDVIYNAADDQAYRKAVSRETNHGFFSRIRRKMGAFKG